MESLHLYYLLALSPTPVSLAVPRTVVKGFGFPEPTLMQSLDGVLSFSPAAELLVPSLFSTGVFVKSLRRHRYLNKAEFKERALVLLHQHSHLVFQECPTRLNQLQRVTLVWCSSRGVKFTPPVEDEKERAELQQALTNLKTVLTTFFSGQRMTALELEFIRSPQSEWMLIAAPAYKLSPTTILEARPAEPKQPSSPAQLQPLSQPKTLLQTRKSVPALSKKLDPSRRLKPARILEQLGRLQQQMQELLSSRNLNEQVLKRAVEILLSRRSSRIRSSRKETMGSHALIRPLVGKANVDAVIYQFETLLARSRRSKQQGIS